jgi:ketosteroid isomerase-like protein
VKLSMFALWETIAGHAAPAGGGKAGGISEDEALRAEQARYAAQTANDFAAMEQLFGDDLVYVHSSTVLDTKASFIESMRSGTVRYRQMQLRGEPRVRTFGAVAIITGRALFEVTVKGEDRALDLLFHSVWARRPSGLQFVSWQATRLPPKA